MAELMSFVVLAIAVSLDSFGVGLTYGMRRMKMPAAGVVLVGCLSAAAVLAAASFGTLLASYLTAEAAELFGGTILITIGIYALWQSLRSNDNPQAPVNLGPEEVADGEESLWFRVEVPWVGVVIRVLRKPAAADLDGSGLISFKEAGVLGIALAMDAFGAGLGAVLLGASPGWLAAGVGTLCMLFLVLGMKGGYMLSTFRRLRPLTFLPGCVLIAIGLWNIM
ncbi:putative sporulation protein YtaF [Salsuginibacillus halophilus]|uniref:Putative sporulation protein YtaF n=1 Tax=Salsuginibacillus halophilus TaxID=517424 RepID=A0A2P8HCV1_9BACI|nr:sporulation membrane protein YtaF [Salsuginibacillus halophilus]PSL44064.1 putative sporulation protein YtaF [Salsuginibacillus halophilus]